MPALICKEDYVFLGADCICEEYIINKSGSYPLALAAREIGAKTYVLAETFKHIRDFKIRTDPELETESVELLRTRAMVCSLRKMYEKVPLRFFDEIITG